ncbi:polysaccharide biosynthesis tyrosine autokinase, partial [Roseimaritima ulvae]
PPVYRSSAKFQLVQPHANQIPVQGVGTAVFAESGSEQTLVMRSETVLERAAELGKLHELTPFAGMSAKEIGARLAASGAFSVKPLGQTVYEISYTSNTQETPLRVLQAIKDAYAEHLIEQQSTVGKEALDLINQARGGVLNRLQELEADFDEFKRNTALVYREGELASIHRDYADRYLRQRQDLVVQQTQLSSKLKAAETAFKAGESTEAVLLLLDSNANQIIPTEATAQNNEPSVIVVEGEKTPVSTTPELTPQPAALSRAESLRTGTLYPLQLQEQELLKTVGENHPTVKKLQAQIRSMQSQIERMETSEREYALKVQQLVERQNALHEQQQADQTPEDLEAIAEQRRREHVRLLVLAMKQQMKLLAHEIEVVTEAYKNETDAMFEERAAEIEHDRLTREIARQQQLYDRIVARLDEVSITAESEGVRIVPLESPKRGSKLTAMQSRSILLGGILGFGAMAGLSLLLGISDKSYQSAEEIAEHLKSPVIGHIPFISKGKFRSKLAPKEGSHLDHSLITFHHPKNPNSEAFKSIRTALFFSSQGGARKVLQVTSSAPAEGKSTIAANIAISIAQSGKNVLLVDADLRRPKVDKLLGVHTEKGLAWALEMLPSSNDGSVGFDVIADAVHDTEVANLSVVAGGKKPENPAELLSSGSLDVFIGLVKDKFDIIIVDSPPMLAVTDPSNIVPRVDGVIMVVRLGKQTRPRSAQAIRMLETLNADIIGVVVNAVGSADAGQYGRYGSREGYNNSNYYREGYGYSYGNTVGAEYEEYYDEHEDDEVLAGK